MSENCKNCPIGNSKCPAITSKHIRYCEIFDTTRDDYSIEHATKMAESMLNNLVDEKGGLPSFVEMATNAAQSWVKYIMSGMKSTSSSQKNHRIQICSSCEKFIPESRRCEECGCFLEIKTGWANEECPLGKWGKDETGELPQQTLANPQPCVPCGQK